MDNIGKIENEKCKIFIKYYLKIIKIINLRFKNDKKFAEWEKNLNCFLIIN